MNNNLKINTENSKEYLKVFKYELERRNCTHKNYTECMRSFFKFCVEENNSDYLKAAQSWVNRLQWKKSSPKTINLHIAAIKRFSTLVLNERINDKDLPRLKEPKKLPDPFSKEEIKRIFELEKNKKHLLVLQVAYYGGLRLGDIVNLKVKNLKFDDGLIFIQNGKGLKDRYAPLPDNTNKELRLLCDEKSGNDYVFTTQYTNKQYPKRTVQKICENACLRAGITGKTNTHRFRHSFGAHMVQAGVNLRIIQESLGHKSSKTTEIYTRVASSGIAEVRNVLVMGN